MEACNRGDDEKQFGQKIFRLRSSERKLKKLQLLFFAFFTKKYIEMVKLILFSMLCCGNKHHDQLYCKATRVSTYVFIRELEEKNIIPA